MKRKDKRAGLQTRAKARKAARGKVSAATRVKAQPSRDKVRAHRARMRARGFRLVQMWLPDTRTPHFAAQAHRASVAIAHGPSEQQDQTFIDAVSWWTSEENAG
jgi:hypothetical protein